MIKDLFTKTGVFMNKHSTVILTTMACVGVCTTVYFAIDATPRAMGIIEEEEYRRRKESKETGEEVVELTKLDIAKLCWKEYLPTIGMGVATISCIVGAQSINTRRNAALAGMYSIAEKSLKEYRDKVVETVGEKKESNIREEIRKDKVKNTPKENIINTGKGDTLCLEPITGRYFRSDIEKIRKAENILNNIMLTGSDVVSLNEFFYELGLPYTKMGEDIGWHLNDGLIEFAFTSALTPDGEPCLVVDQKIEPRYSYMNIY